MRNYFIQLYSRFFLTLRAIIFVLAISVFQMVLGIDPGNLFIRNYSPEEFRAYPQNWAVVQDQRGIIYVANNHGVLEFDGKTWQSPLPVPNKSPIRSLAVDKHGTVYVGAQGDFGYLAIDALGKHSFVSFIDKIAQKDRQFIDVWHIFVTGQGIFFITDYKTFLWDYRHLQVIPVSTGFLSYFANPHIFARERNGGISMLHDQQLIMLPHTERFDGNFNRMVILPYHDQKIVIVTAQMGLFIYHLDMIFHEDKFLPDISSAAIPSAIIEPFSTEVAEYLKQNLIYCGIRLNARQYAFGTMRGGITIMDDQGKLVRLVNMQHGLQDNSVWDLTVDRNQNLWAALNYGTSLLITSSPVSTLNQLNDLKGIILSAIRYQGNFYAGTFTGIYYLPQPQKENPYQMSRFLPVRNTKTHCFDFLPYKDFLLALGGEGVWQVMDDLAITLTNIPDPYCFGVSAKFPDRIFVGFSSGIKCLQVIDTMSVKTLNQKVLRIAVVENSALDTIREPIRAIAEDASGDLWLSTQYNGILQLVFATDRLDDCVWYRYTTKHGLPDLSANKIHSLDNQLLVATKKGIYLGKKNHPSKMNNEYVFVPDLRLGRIFYDNSTAVSHIVKDNQQWFYISSGLGIGLVARQQNGDLWWNPTPFKMIKGGIEKIYVEENGIAWFCAAENRSIYRYDSAREKDYEKSFPALIRRVRAGADNRIVFSGNYFHPASLFEGKYKKSSLQQPAELILKLANRDNSLSIDYSAAFYEFENDILFHHTLQGYEDHWSEWLPEAKKEFSNLAEGKYCFVVKARNVFGKESLPAMFRFSISPPWQRTWWAYLFYLIALSCVFYLGIRLNSQRLLAAQKKLEKIITQRTMEVVRQKEEIASQKDKIEDYAANLFETNHKLTETNYQLNVARDALWGEMELAKKIQTVLLPGQPQIPGYEISAYMNPADEVGGDYYDVICIENNDCRGGACLHPDSERAEEKDGESRRGGSCARPQDSALDPKILSAGSSPIPKAGQPQGFAPTCSSYWLAIGDVSGHGVSAGLVMMMMQTAIHTVLRKTPFDPPDKILSAVNQVIFENIKKMGEDKYMTFTLLSVQPNGVFHYSGLHQDIMIFRSISQEVELIETKGMWIGLLDEIRDQLTLDQFMLQTNDVMLLYTDGVVEATDSNGAMFSEEKLAKILRQNGLFPVEQIKQQLLESLTNYNCADDITFLIVKRV